VTDPRAAIASLAVALAAAACSIDHRSGDFACENQSDCSGGRMCIDGLCIDPNAPDARGPDAAVDRADARPTCPDQCTACDPEEKICVIDCSLTSCEAQVTCPAGFTCDIRCNIQNSCRNGVSCAGAKGCAIACSGTSACRDVVCGSGPCDITCSGFQACRDVNCGNSCACDIDCSGPQSCSDGIVCTEFQCDIGLGCSSFPLGCNTCQD
jgi:hypothetical protein